MPRRGKAAPLNSIPGASKRPALRAQNTQGVAHGDPPAWGSGAGVPDRRTRALQANDLRARVNTAALKIVKGMRSSKDASAAQQRPADHPLARQAAQPAIPSAATAPHPLPHPQASGNSPGQGNPHPAPPHVPHASVAPAASPAASCTLSNGGPMCSRSPSPDAAQISNPERVTRAPSPSPPPPPAPPPPAQTPAQPAIMPAFEPGHVGDMGAYGRSLQLGLVRLAQVANGLR